MSKISFFIERAASGRSTCKGCKEKIAKDSLRIGKRMPNFFAASGEYEMTQFYHPKHYFDSIKRAKATTKRVESVDDLNGFDKLTSAEQDEIQAMIE